jgi:hypothetical protein
LRDADAHLNDTLGERDPDRNVDLCGKALSQHPAPPLAESGSRGGRRRSHAIAAEISGRLAAWGAGITGGIRQHDRLTGGRTVRPVGGHRPGRGALERGDMFGPANRASTPRPSSMPPSATRTDDRARPGAAARPRWHRRSALARQAARIAPAPNESQNTLRSSFRKRRSRVSEARRGSSVRPIRGFPVPTAG